MSDVHSHHLHLCVVVFMDKQEEKSECVCCNEAWLCFNNIEAVLGALQAVGVFYCSPLSGSEVDHYRVALASHGYEISGGPSRPVLHSAECVMEGKSCSSQSVCCFDSGKSRKGSFLRWLPLKHDCLLVHNSFILDAPIIRIY